MSAVIQFTHHINHASYPYLFIIAETVRSSPLVRIGLSVIMARQPISVI